MMNFTVHINEFLPLMPVLIVALTAVIVMIFTSIKRHHTLIATLTAVGLNIALFYLVIQFAKAYHNTQGATELASVMGMFIVDNFTLFYQLIILVAALACCTLAHAYIERYSEHKEELYVLMLFSVVGAMLLIASSHYAAFFISLELMSIPIYGLLAYTHQRKKSLEAGVKYLVLSATASAILLMGMAFVYAYMGTLSFYAQIDGQPTAFKLFEQIQHQPLVILGLGMMLFAIAFKLSLAPFHKWTPDIYQGAPAPIATFLATVAKVAMIGLFIRYLLASGIIIVPSIQVILTILAIASIIMGNLLALRQNNLKRILGYSSIAHFGYLLLSPISMTYADTSIASVTMYILTYTFTTIGAFGVITLMSSPYRKHDVEELSAYNGLFWRHPILSATLTVMMLSLAGIPLTAGFIAKFLIIKDTVVGANWLLAVILIIGSGIGLYYYLRVVITLYKKPLDNEIKHAPQANWGKQAGGIMVFIASLAVLILGIYPDLILDTLDSVKIISSFHDYLIDLSKMQGGAHHHIIH